jgi:hypothetical protein
VRNSHRNSGDESSNNEAGEFHHDDGFLLGFVDESSRENKL